MKIIKFYWNSNDIIQYFAKNFEFFEISVRNKIYNIWGI
jgi:hypothetical protein